MKTKHNSHPRQASGSCLVFRQGRALSRNKKGHNSQIHILIGFGVLFALFLLNKNLGLVDISSLTNLQVAFIFFITWVYSQMPDVDLPNTRISEYVTVFGMGLIIWSFMQGDKTLGIWTAIILAVFRMVRHRTVIHTLLAGVIISAPLYMFNPIYGVIALIMFLAHIISENEFSIWSGKNLKIFK